MSTTLLYHTLGVTGCHYLKSDFSNGKVVFHVTTTNAPIRCPGCGSRNVLKRGRVRRHIRTVPIAMKPVFIGLDIPRVECRVCGLVRQINLQFADKRLSYTRAFERYVLCLGKLMTIQDVARHLKVGWDMVKEIQKRHLLKQYARPRLKHLRFLAIDEIAVAKGHRYFTIVLEAEVDCPNIGSFFERDYWHTMITQSQRAPWKA